jgi:hypothetical protein
MISKEKSKMLARVRVLAKIIKHVCEVLTGIEPLSERLKRAKKRPLDYLARGTREMNNSA